MLKDKILTWLQKLQEIDAMKSSEEKTQAINDFFTKDLEDLGLRSGDYVYHDVVRGDLRRRDFIYGEEEDGSDVVLHVWTGGGQRDKISISSHSLEEYEQAKKRRGKVLT